MSEAVGVIVAAIIAGWVSFFSLIISKEQSVSEFRQQWIDELRKDISLLVARVSGIHGESIATGEESHGQLWARVRTDVSDFNKAIARIRLRLNPQENRGRERQATAAVLTVLNELESIFASPRPEFHRLHALVTALVTETQVILKENWERVKVGEPTYRLAKRLTLVVTVLALIAGLLYEFKPLLRHLLVGVAFLLR